MEGNMVMTVQGSAVDVEDQEGPGTSRRRGSRRVPMIAGAVAVVLVVSGGGVAYAAWNSDQNEKLATATQAWESAQDAERRAIEDGTAALDASLGKVADDQVRQELADLIGAGGESRSGNVGDASRADKTAAYTDLAAGSQSRTAQIRAAIESVSAAQAAWELEQAQAGYAAALAQLTASLDAAGAVLAGSEGKVLDEAARQQLAVAIESGTAVRDAVPAAGVDALVTATGSLTESVGAVDAASSAVAASQTAWQAEQDRVAAEAAAAAAAQRQAAASSSGKKAASSSGTARSGSAGESGGSTGSSGSARRLGGNPGPNFGTGNAPACTTPSCGITF